MNYPVPKNKTFKKASIPGWDTFRCSVRMIDSSVHRELAVEFRVQDILFPCALDFLSIAAES